MAKLRMSTNENEARHSRLQANVEFAPFEGNPDFVLSLARGLRVIETFEAHTEGLSSAEVSRRTGCHAQPYDAY